MATREDMAQVKSHAITTQNNTTRLLNQSKYFTSPGARLTPPVNPQTETQITQAPKIQAEIFALSPAEATRILRQLNADVPQDDREKRKAMLHYEFGR